MRTLRSAVLAALAMLCALPARAAPDIDDLARSATNFSYYQLGRHVPERSGWADYDGARAVLHRDIRLPLEISPAEHTAANPQHMYCNTQVWGFLDNGRPTGKSNHIINYTFPWTSTFCERRDFPGTFDQQTKACGRGADGNLRKSHQGSDCRPPAPKADTYWMVAVEPGTVVLARSNIVEMVGDSGIKWKYRHGGAPRAEITPSGGRGVRVAAGTRLARVADLRSTPIHLHLESERPAGTDRDNLPSLVLAYERALGVAETPVSDGTLAFDPRFEIAEGAAPNPCAESAGEAPLEPDRTVPFQSYWCHNGSIVGLVRQEDRVQLVYHQPRAGIRASAARHPVLVDASENGDAWRGAATWFSSRCGDRQFDVSGRASEIGGVRHVTVAGRRPSFTGSCDAPRFLDETLVFSFLRAGEGGEPDEPPVTPPEGVLVPEYGVHVTGECEAVAGAAPVDGFAEFDVASLWCHNGSLMGLVLDGAQRRIVYLKPRETIRASVARNRILITATLADGRYRGRALWFNSACGDPTFDVAGQETLRDGVRTIELAGERRVLRSNCSVLTTRTETLAFSFLAAIAGSGEGNVPIPEAGCAATAAQDPIRPQTRLSVASLWCFENSVVGLAEEGADRRLYYYKPDAGVRAAATERPLLFEGSVRDGAYRGTLHLAQERCGSRATEVSGFEATANGVPGIVLRGRGHPPGTSCSAAAQDIAFNLTFRGSERLTFGGMEPVATGPVCRTDAETVALRAVLSAENIRRFSSVVTDEHVDAIVCHAGFLVDQKITPGLRLAHFMAQIATETGGMKRLDENMDYTATRLREVFPFVTSAQAQRLAHKPREIANFVYGHRTDLGNLGRHTDDGWNYRGSGFIQLTGRANFRDRGAEVGLALEANPELARRPMEGLLAATAYWSARSINTPADADSVRRVRLLVNGGTNGLAEARLWLAKARPIFGGPSMEDDPEAREALVAILTARGALPAAEAPPTATDLAAALRTFQERKALPPSGVLDDPTFMALVDPDAWRKRD